MYMQMIINLLLVVSFIVAYFLLMHWLNKKKRGKFTELELIASLPLGAKEKIILVQANHQRFMLGVTQQNISILAALTPEKSHNEEVGLSFQDFLNENADNRLDLEKI